MRTVAIYRETWTHLGDELTGPTVAAILSLFETCARLGVYAREHLTEVLPCLAEWLSSRVVELTPMAWKAAKAK